MTSPHQGRFIDNPERPPARHDSLAGQSAFADRRSAPALPSVLRCACPPSPTFCAASVRQASACRPPHPSRPTPSGAEAALFDCGSSEPCFGRKRNHRKPRASGADRFSESLPKHIKTQRLRSGGRAPPSPHQRALPVQTFLRSRNKRCGRHGMVSSSRFAQRRGLSPRCVEMDACFPCCFMPLGIPRKKSPARKTPPRSPPRSPPLAAAGRPAHALRSPAALRQDAKERSTRPRCYSRRCCSVLSFRPRAGICDRSQRAALTMPGGCRAKLPRR